MQNWEYFYIRFRSDGLVYRVNRKNIDDPSVHWHEYANELGSQGWELVATSGELSMTLIFKRPKS